MIAAQALCLPDGTPVLLVVRSGCVECGTTPADPQAIGWINPQTGVFTPGVPPAGAGPCDGGCATVTTVQLCDLLPDGDCQMFLRHLVRDCDGAVTSSVDTTLDGVTPYTVTGTAGSCAACSAGCVETICVQRCDDTDGDGQADAAYSELWCVRADGGAELVLTYQADPSTPYTPIAPVECTYGCPETETVTLCDASGPFLRRYTFLTGQASYEDVELDGQTPHIVTGTVGVCASDSDCLDTVCRTRCDDTDGDGQADATYSELWCVHADGSADLVLTYQDDPSVAYTPVAPVECGYGAVASEALTLCDDSGPFLRRYTWLNGAASYEDVEFDGQTPHVVTGTVRTCTAETPCEAQTTPAATLGLCLADGTPIAVLVTRDCNGTITRDGWLNLTTGTYSAGEPPAGTMACGNPRSISTTGTFCDVDPASGDVYGLVLIEYTYGADGAVAAVRLVDATTGQTYVPQGEVTTCPAGVAQPERDLVQLCDTTAGGGTVTPFVRDFARDENGAITGHTDYLLDGSPYTPTGTVGRCVDQCRDCETVVLCDTIALPPTTIAGTAAAGTLPNGVTYSVTAPSAFPPGRQSDGAAWWGVALFPNPNVPLTRWTFNQPVTVDFSVAMVYSTGTATSENTVQLPPGAVPLSLPSGYTYNQVTRILRADATLTGCTLNSPTRAASARFRVTGVSTFTLQYLGGRTLSTECRRFGTWEFGALDVFLGGQFARTVCRDCTGEVVSSTDTLLDGTTPYAPVGLVGVCQPDAEEPGEPVEPDTEVVQLCDTAADGISTAFLRVLTFPAGGGTPTVADTALDGVTPYTPVGTVGVCQPSPVEAEPCRDSSSTLLCDTVAQDAITVFDPAARPGSDGWQVVSFTGANPGYPPEGPLLYDAPHPPGPFMGARNDLSAGPGPAWPGYDLAPHRWVLRRTFTAPEDGIASVSSVGFRGDGGARVRVNGQDAGMYGQWNQPATSGTAQIPVTAGPNTVEIEVRDGGGNNWVQGRLDIVMTRTQQFMRRTVVDCETGETVSVVDTTLDGEPYEVTGVVGQCEPVAECCEQPPPETRLDVETALMCAVDQATGTTLGQVLVERLYDDQTGERTEQRLTDPTTGDPLTLPAGAVLAACPAENTVCRNASTLLLCDLPTDGTPTPTVTDTSGTPYYPYTTGVPTAGAQTLWDGGTLTLPDAAGPQPGTTGTVRTAAATIQAPRPVCDAGTAHVTVQVDVTQLGPDTGCAATGFLGLYNGTGEANRVALALAPPNTPAGWTGTLTAEADVPAADLAAGNVAVLVAFDAYDDSGAICPPPRRTGWQLAEFDATVVYDQAGCPAQFLRTVTTDCETGAVVSVTDTTLDGASYTVTGEAGQCTPTSSGSTVVEPCGDTELALLCDLTYDPQAPIPTPAGDFTLTGNVVAGNEGTTLWFAQANQPANGVAELTVSGLLPAVLYEFRFASAWIGAGAPDPANNNAIYLLEVLDGATVLATRTRNTSNGSNVFPGGVLSEDLPPLAFIAPATGAVTIRFIDQTTGGAINDRDLFLMPFEVRTAALTLKRTPFLRRFTFDCDGGLTSTQDLGLDGVTPYTLQGVEGTCGGDSSGGAAPGPDTEVIQLCDVASDGSSTPFLRQLTYEPGADTPTVVDIALDGVTSYTPAGTVDICQGAAEGRDVELTPMCVVDNNSGGVIQRILAEVTYDTATGDRLGVNYVDPITWGPVALPGGTHLDVCPEEQPDPTPDIEVIQLCDLVDGQDPVPFLRHLAYLPGATAPVVTDTELDVVTPYAPVGEVGVCPPPSQECQTVSTVELCDVLPDGTRTRFLRHITRDCQGEVTGTADTLLDAVTPYTVTGESGDCACPSHLLTECRWDATTGGVADTPYLELIAVDGCTGELTTLGTYLPDLSAPYEPVSPTECPVEGAPPAYGVQARRVVLSPGGSWDAAGISRLQSVTVTVSGGGSGSVTTADGTSPLLPGESVTWSVQRDQESALVGPLSVAVTTGNVGVTWTIGVIL
ncbi:hypothetical protein [Streptosporangium sp. CA-115845]|uniref:hypothetical protein n=1 Tax=Streptosporangium sp. CA-115845 TaxID=3240071 RepID=UPI003D8CE132